MHVAVDASDLEQRIVRVHETLTGVNTGTVLLFPKWLPGNHAPEGPIDRLAGIRITAAGTPVAWTRDPANVYAFRIHPNAGAHSIDIDFQYLSPTSAHVGAPEISRDILMLEWNELLLYPAGYFTRQIPVEVSVTLPAQWHSATALETARIENARTQFKRTTLETLIDSPIYAGRYTTQVDLDPGSSAPVHLNLFADRPALLAIKPEQVKAYQGLVQQAYKLFGAHHYGHYDFLYSLSDQLQQAGLEHHQSSEDGSDPESLTKWDETAYERELLPHEFTHSWNGKFRRPADLWTPDYNVPMQNSLLWVYEGQTEYWGYILSARSGLWTRQQVLDRLALVAAGYEAQPGRQWRSLEDTTNDEIMNLRRPLSWASWQRFEDYYDEGALIWLDADTLIRERSKGKRSLDDFAHAFFGIDNGSFTVVTYTFEDVVKTLNSVEPYDWATFLQQRIAAPGRPVPLDGFRRGGYKLVYTDTPSDLLKAVDEHRKLVTLLFSIGVEINDKQTEGLVTQVVWDGPAFKAGLTAGAQIIAVNGFAYSADVLKDAIRAAQGTKSPVELIVKTGDRYRVVNLDYHGGLRYPHLERDSSKPALLDDIAAARP